MCDDRRWWWFPFVVDCDRTIVVRYGTRLSSEIGSSKILRLRQKKNKAAAGATTTRLSGGYNAKARESKGTNQQSEDCATRQSADPIR